MKRFSSRRRARLTEVAPFREAFKLEIGRCERCSKRRHLDVHEIARGIHRQAALDKRYALLCLCRTCHDHVGVWGRAKQLAVLYVRRPYDFDLSAFHALTGRVFPDLGDVMEWVEPLMDELNEC